MVTIKIDEKIKSKYDRSDQYDYSTPSMVTVHAANYAHFVYYNNPGNCKVCTIARLQDALLGKSDETRLVVINRLKEFFVAVRKLVFNCTFTSKIPIDILKQHFELVYMVEVPIGYGQGLQYHCSFRTGNDTFPGYAGYVPRLKSFTEKFFSKDKPVIQVTMTRKHADKILSYKHKGYLNRYLNKLVNGENL